MRAVKEAMRMNFGEQIKRIRAEKNLTQQQMADAIGVTRQAVSNWENDKNLPDIEMLITMAQTFQLTLDELILGGKSMNNMTEKLINDTKETRRVKMNLIGIVVGAVLLALGFVSLVLGAFVPLTWEGYFGTAFSVLSSCGVLTFMLVGLKNLVDLFFRRQAGGVRVKLMAAGGLAVLLGVGLYVISWFTEYVNSYFGFGAMLVGAILVIVGACKKDK